MNKLEHANEQLQLSNNIKEEYVGRFMNLCSVYINRLDTYRRMVNKKISAGQMEELLKMVRSREVLDAGRGERRMDVRVVGGCLKGFITRKNVKTWNEKKECIRCL